MSVLPLTASWVYDAGELSRSKPLILTESRSPPSRVVLRPSRRCTVNAPSGSLAGMIPAAPLSSAVTIVEVARKTSMTTAAVAGLRAAATAGLMATSTASITIESSARGG